MVLATDLWIGFARADAQVGRVATLYLQAIAFGLPAALATRVFVALNAAVSRPKVTMVVNVTALLLKAPLNLSSCTEPVRFPPWAARAPAWRPRCCPG